jgi:hypothetical protein
MTTTIDDSATGGPDPPETAEDTALAEPELCWAQLSDLRPHPDNPRTSLGNLTELVSWIDGIGEMHHTLIASS